MTLAMTPSLPSIIFLFINYFINGIAEGGLEAAADVWITEIWGNDCGPWVQLLQFSYSFGTILAPVIVKPFLAGETDVKVFLMSSDGSTLKSRLWIPFLTIGLIMIILSVIIFILYFIAKFESSDEWVNVRCYKRNPLKMIQQQLWPTKYKSLLIGVINMNLIVF